jgi:membrane-bound lytic murein transglycosylase MltF
MRFIVAVLLTLSVLVSAVPASAEPPFQKLFQEVGAKHDLDWRLLAAIAKKESRFDPDAVGPNGARGMMQVLPETALGMGASIWDLTDPEQGVEIGARYFRRLLDVWLDEPNLSYETRLRFAVAAYHVGPGRLKRLRQEAVERGLDRDRWAGNVEKMVAEGVARSSAAYVDEVFATRASYRDL